MSEETCARCGGTRREPRPLMVVGTEINSGQTCRLPFHAPDPPAEHRGGDQKIEAWLCPNHGIIDEVDLIEGQDSALANASDPDGWTDTFYCSRCNAETRHTALVPASLAAQATQELEDERLRHDQFRQWSERAAAQTEADHQRERDELREALERIARLGHGCALGIAGDALDSQQKETPDER